MNPDPTLQSAPATAVQPRWDERIRRSSALIPALVVMLLAVVGLAATLVARHVDERAPRSLLGATAPDDGTPPAVMSPQAQASLAPSAEPVRTAPRPAPVTRPASQAPVVSTARPAAEVCSSCGVVESVTALRQQGQGSGLGAVAGGVAGGLLGSQIGGGSGKTAATIVGAVGGGFAGNAIEKHYKSTTVYRVRVRMNDGSVRTVDQSTAPAAGSRVIVEGNTLRAA